MIRFAPQYQAAPWGGRRLAEEFGRNIPDGRIGESWELAELGDRVSRVSSGPMEGKSIGALWRDGALGGRAGGVFPFVLKWLDAEHKLSVQVHPDERFCREAGAGLPKTEAWYVCQAEPKATLLVGHYPGLDGATLRQAAGGGTLPKWLYETRPRVGDMILLKAGTIHCIGAGFLLLEVQQPSDTTFRIYDWGRLGSDGVPRDVHLEEAVAAVNYQAWGAPKLERQGVQGPGFFMKGLHMGAEVPSDGLRVLVAESGPVKLKTEKEEVILNFGDVVVAEPGDGQVCVATGTAVLVSEVPAST